MTDALWDGLFPHTPRSAHPIHVPRCAKSMRVWVYDLPRTYNSELLRRMELRRGASSCDYERSSCVETVRSRPRRDGWDYSNLRQYAAEIPLLAKLLQLPRARTPQEADLFVVPYLASTELSGHQYTPWYPREKRVAERFERLLGMLDHFRGAARARHLFLSSRDWTFTVVKLKELVASSGALMASYGPKRADAHNEIIVAPNSAGFGASLQPLTHPASIFLFSMMDESINPIRQDVGRELRRLRSRPNLRVEYHPIGDHRSISLSPLNASRLMSDSLLCPIIQGDLPYQHRLFDALAAGCVPLLLRYIVNVGGKACEAWSWDARNKSAMRGVARVTLDYSICVRQHLPFPLSVDWDAITVRIDASALATPGRLAEMIAALDREEVARKRRRLERMRHLFVYDREGQTSDAFSAFMVEVCDVLRALPARRLTAR